MKVQFSQEEGNCGGGEDKGRIWKEGERIKFKGIAVTPNPCYRLSLTHYSTENRIELQITKQSTNQICIQCLARIPFEGELYELEPDGREVILNIGETEVSRKIF